MPKREGERVRRTPKDEPISRGTMMPVRVPNADPSWHPLVKNWYKSLKTSGISKYYQNSDWATAQLIAHELSIQFETKRHSAEMMATLFSAMKSLGTTEGDRRSMRIELDQMKDGEEEKSAKVVAMDAYKNIAKAN